MKKVYHILTDAEVSQNLQVLSEQLHELVKNAEKVRSEPFEKFKDELSRKLIWLRPSVGGISAISCCENTPQRGSTNISIRSLEKILEKQLLPPGRNTPEKHLQSWLIKSALKSGGRLKVLDDILGGQYWFVSDEIAIKAASIKVVADLLLVRVDAEGLASLVSAELKSDRAMQTFKQVVCFRAALENPGLQKDWKEFAEVMTGKRFQWHPSHETRGVVIWPAVGGNQKNALANEKRKDYARVDVIGYRAVPGEINNCTLQFEKLTGNGG